MRLFLCVCSFFFLFLCIHRVYFFNTITFTYQKNGIKKIGWFERIRRAISFSIKSLYFALEPGDPLVFP